MSKRYQVKVTQEVPFVSQKNDGMEITGSTGQVEKYIAGEFTALHLAELFAESLEAKIAESAGFVTNCYTPKVHLLEIEQQITEIKVRKQEGKL